MSNNKPRRRTLGRLIPRLIVGGYFVGHGAQKQFGIAGGPGLEATAAWFESVGLKPGALNAQAAAGAELGGGALLALGILPTVAATSLIATMITAVRIVHLQKGPWNADGGFELNLVMIAAAMAIVDASSSGSGSFKALTALAGGAIASTAVIEAAKRQ